MTSVAKREVTPQAWVLQQRHITYTKLDLRERRAIEEMLSAKYPSAKIAVWIGKRLSTMRREITQAKWKSGRKDDGCKNGK